MSEEKPKSIWKKSFKGRTALAIWLAVVVFTIILGGFIAALLNWNHSTSDAALTASFVAGGLLAACLILTYFIWPLARFFLWKHWRRTLFSLACFATLIALFYAEEDWRGKHDWNQFKHEQEAKGEKFDFKDFIPPPVRDSQNFAMQPIWVESIKATLGPKNSGRWFGTNYAENGRTNFIGWLDFFHLYYDGTQDKPEPGNWDAHTLTDLKAWQAYYREARPSDRANKSFLPAYYPHDMLFSNSFPVSPLPQTPAQDVLEALSKYDEVIEKLRAAAELPYSRFPIYNDADTPFSTLLPHLSSLKTGSQVLQLRAIAELQNNQSDPALADIKLMFRLIAAVHAEPFSISQLVRASMLQLAIQPIYEGLAEHRWSDAQLKELDEELGRLDFLADYRLGIRGEMAIVNAAFNFLRQQPKMLPDLSGAGNANGGYSAAARFVPDGWFYQNQLRFDRFLMFNCLPICDDANQIVSPTKAHQAQLAFAEESRKITPYNFIERRLLSHFWEFEFAYGQASVDLARTAIALERYRLAHEDYPASLAALAPQFIAAVPHDVIGGGPLHYRRAADGRFVLYSIGWNERDDGGVVVFNKGDSGQVNISEGDWVWRYPAK